MAKSAKSKRVRTVSTEVSVTVIGVDSNYESVTQAAYAYREKNVYPHLTAKGLNVVKFQGPLARRSYVAPAVTKPGVEYLTGVGHGSYDDYTGDWYDPIFQIGNYSPSEPTG